MAAVLSYKREGSPSVDGLGAVGRQVGLCRGASGGKRRDKFLIAKLRQVAEKGICAKEQYNDA